VLAGSFGVVNGVSRVGVARLNRDGSLDANFNPAIESFEYAWPWVNALGLQWDGKILIGGEFDTVNGQARTNLARLLNTAPAVENLVVDTTGILWTRTGSCPEVWRMTFEYSLDGQTWHSLGAGTRVPNGWRLTGVSIPDGSTVRARGYLTGGQGNGSGWFVETRVTPVLPIRLRIQLIGSEVLLSWTGGRPPFQVQKTYELTSPVAWTNVGEPVWTNAMVLSVEQSNVFFRVYGQ